VLEHQPAAINALVVLAPSPIAIDPFVFLASPALFRMPVISLIVQIDDALAAITPDHR
jgi:hypothetical protein